jgi:hypothetical protein
VSSGLTRSDAFRCFLGASLLTGLESLFSAKPLIQISQEITEGSVSTHQFCEILLSGLCGLRPQRQLAFEDSTQICHDPGGMLGTSLS